MNSRHCATSSRVVPEILGVPMAKTGQEAMNRLATLPRQAEWEAFVAKFQGCAADARSDEKWQPMERMFRLYE